MGLLATCALGSLGFSSAAAAQAAGSDDGSNEIIVTALKQNEALLDTPATVKVIGDEALEIANVSNAQQLSGIVPGYFAVQGTAGTSASFRGLGSNSSDPSIESSVGVFVDGVYLGHARDFTMPLYDTQQIEFIAGTQSTLLGRNTSLGAISIASRRPGRDFGVDLAGTYTSEIEGLRFDGGVDVPLGESFAARAAVLYNKENGFVTNAYLGRSERDIEELSGRLVLDGNLGESVRLTAIYQHDRRRTKGQYLELFTDPNGSVAGTADMLGQTDFDVVPNDVTYSGSELFDPDAPPVALPFDNQDGDRATVVLEGELGGGLTLTSQTSYVKWDSQRVTDLDFTAFRLLDLNDIEDNEVFSQELRLSSQQGERFTYNLGAFYYWNNYSLRRIVGSELGLDLDSQAVTKTVSWSLFASGRYEFSEQFALRGGLRQTWEDKRVRYDISGNLANLSGQFSLPSVDNAETDGNIGIEFRPNDRTMFYATWARGSKNGGFQTNPDSLASAAYGPEAAYSAEAGAKFDLGNRSFLELALFDTRVKNFQTGRLVVIPPSPLPETVISNADVRSTGGEISGQWAASDSFTLTGSLTYADSRFTQDVLNEVDPGVFEIEVYDGMRLPRAPRWMGRLGFEYRTALSNRLELNANGLLRYASTSDLQFRSTNPLSPKAESNATIDLQIGVSDKQAGWSIALIGNNLTDKRVATFTSQHLFDDDAYYGTRNRPRTIAVQLKFTR
jgi:outer membrane receptor protein involved in Fe transport